MSDDGDLRTRIEARVAARRTGAEQGAQVDQGGSRPRPRPRPDASPVASNGHRSLARPVNGSSEEDAPDEDGPDEDGRARRTARWLLARRVDDEPAESPTTVLPAIGSLPAANGNSPASTVGHNGTSGANTAPLNGRPRPRPSAPLAAASATTPDAAAEAPARPRPRPSTPTTLTKPPAVAKAPPPAETPRTSSGDPALDRFLDASEPQPEDNYRERRPFKETGFGKFWARARRPILRIVIVVVIAVGAALLLRQFVVAPYYIPSASMEPTLHGCTGCNNDHILVDKISYRFHGPHEGDVVVFDRPKGVPVSESVLIKRVIGLPGDRVTMRNGVVSINGQPLKEPYLDKDHSCYRQPISNFTTTVGDGKVFVMGDNRCDSTDSRSFGAVKESTITGRAWLIVYPLDRIGSL